MLLLAIVALGVPLAINLSGRVTAEVRNQAQGQADLVAQTAADLLGAKDRTTLDGLATKSASFIRGRVLIVDRNAHVLVDSGTPAQIGVNYESRREIDAALDGRRIQLERYSNTLHQEILATAVPIVRNGRTVGAVRVTESVAALHSAVQRVLLSLGLIALIVLALGLAGGALIAAQIVRPLKRLEQVARRVAHGDLRARAELEGSREQRSLASSFNEMTDRISRLLSAQQDFVADASHQLRTPLTGLRLRLEEARAVGSGPAASEIDAAISEVDRLSHTVEELLVLSRGGDRQTAAASLDLEGITEFATQRWHAKAEQAGIQLEARTDGSPSLTWAARPDIERALDALIENAVHYSPAGSTVSVVTCPGRIEVQDRGPGVAADERELVFERFHRGRSGRSGAPGSGLGLPIARELAREWGGEVFLADRPGGGTVATLALPAPGDREPQTDDTTEGRFAPA